MTHHDQGPALDVPGVSMTPEEMERAVVRKCIEELIGHGFELSLYDGGDWPIRDSADADAVFAEMFATGKEKLWAKRPEGWKQSQKSISGMLFLVYGNDGYDVIADYSVCLEPFLVETSKLEKELGG